MATKYKKRKDGRYLVQVQIGYQDNGKPKYKSIYGRTIAELEKKVVEFKSNLYKGIIVDDENLTLGKWAEHWIDTYKSNGSYSLEIKHRTVLNKHLVPLKDIKLRNLKVGHLQDFINEKSKECNVNQIAGSLKEMLKQAVKNELIYRNPMESVVVPKAEHKKRRALTDIERRAIEKADLTNFERAFIYVCMYAGLRRGETLALMRNDIDFKNGIIKVNKTLTNVKNGKALKDSTKTPAGAREIPMTDMLKNQLAAHMEEIEGLYIFPNQNGTIMGNPSFDLVWKRIMKKLNEAAGGNDDIIVIKDITPHYLRHTYATDIFYAGIDLKTAQYLMGHATLEMTMDLYTHMEKDNEDVKQKLQDYTAFIQSKISQSN